MSARRVFLRMGAVLAAAAVLCAASALGESEMREGVPAPPPSGFISFCMREPRQCASDGTARKVLHLDKRASELLESINSRINGVTRWVDDFALHGRKEYFAIITDNKGDCDDIVVTKRALLHAAGIPLHDLRIAIALTPAGEEHSVLVVTTDEGDLVLDSLEAGIRRWQDVGYRWLKRQDGSAMGWENIPEGMAGKRSPERGEHARGTLVVRPH